MSRRTKGWLLAGLIAVWTLLLAMRVLNYEEPMHAPLTYRSGQAAVNAHQVPVTGVPMLKTVASPDEEALARKGTKNIFAPLALRVDTIVEAAKLDEDAADRPVRRGKRRVHAAHAMPNPAELAAEEARQRKEMAVQQARQLMAQYRFIGYLTQHGKPRAFLGKGKDLFIVGAGEILEGTIEVAEIDATTLKLRDPMHAVESALPLARDGAAAPPGMPSPMTASMPDYPVGAPPMMPLPPPPESPTDVPALPIP